MMLLLPPSSSFGVVRLFVISAVVAGTSRRNGIAVAGFHLSPPPPPPSQLLATPSSTSKSTLSSASAIQRITNKMLISTTSSTAIHVGAASTSSFNNMNNHNHDNANNYPQLLLDNASACALSDSCSIEYAEMYLREIFRVQVGCAVLDMEDRLPATTTRSSSTATATNAAIAATTTGRIMIEEECNIDNLHAIGEIVAKLKDKIRHHGEAVMEVDGKNAVTAFWNQRQVELETLAASTSVDAAASSPTSSIFAAPIKPAYLAIAALYTIAIIHAFHSPPSMVETTAATTTAAVVVPFTFQEIWYAIRDGYIDTLIGHWFHNGGLLIGGGGNVDGAAGGDDYATLLVSSMTSSSTTATTPSASSSFVLSPREVFWSIRDGYVDDTLFSSSSSSSVLPSLLSSYNIMESSSIRDAQTTAPFSPQEVWWAIQGGYAADMIGHWFRNGGV